MIPERHNGMESMSMSAWMPIDSAPKDGRTFLAVNAEKPSVTYRVVYFDEDAKKPYCWHVEDARAGFEHHSDFFTHWMPLPEPPVTP